MTREDTRFRNALLMLLAVTAGATDATAFERLGHVFASVITGNLVVLGVGSVRADGRLALLAGCALGAYALGVILAAPRRPEDNKARPVWPSSVTLALRADLLCLVAFAVMWEIVGGAPGQTAQVVMLVLCGTAMGVQSTAVRRLGQISTTYMTSAMTGVLEAVVARRWTEAESRSVGILLALLVGAAAATALISYLHEWLPAVQLLPLVIVELASVRLVRAAEA
jgi:uncharacterized membrane protein YoaK (UPF0700 family)